MDCLEAEWVWWWESSSLTCASFRMVQKELNVALELAKKVWLKERDE